MQMGNSKRLSPSNFHIHRKGMKLFFPSIIVRSGQCRTGLTRRLSRPDECCFNPSQGLNHEKAISSLSTRGSEQDDPLRERWPRRFFLFFHLQFPIPAMLPGAGCRGTATLHLRHPQDQGGVCVKFLFVEPCSGSTSRDLLFFLSETNVIC